MKLRRAPAREARGAGTREGAEASATLTLRAGLDDEQPRRTRGLLLPGKHFPS